MAIAVGKTISRKQVPDRALLVDKYPSWSVALNLNTEEAANWTEVCHSVLGMKKFLMVVTRSTDGEKSSIS